MGRAGQPVGAKELLFLNGIKRMVRGMGGIIQGCRDRRKGRARKLQGIIRARSRELLEVGLKRVCARIPFRQKLGKAEKLLERRKD